MSRECGVTARHANSRVATTVRAPSCPLPMVLPHRPADTRRREPTPQLAKDVQGVQHIHSIVPQLAQPAGPPPDSITTMLGLEDESLLQFGCFINGCWETPAGAPSVQVENPATGRSLVAVSKGGAEEAKAAVAAAAAAFPSWATLTPGQRADILLRWHGEILKARSDLTRLISLECGKPLSEACAEFDKGVGSLPWFAEEARRCSGELLPAVDSRRQFMAVRAPVGVVAALTAWNFPLSLVLRKVAPALAAGCTVVLKPSELAPLTALALAELARRAGLPPGVLNVVCGDAPAIADTLLASPQVRKLSFTGSTAVGKRLMAAAAGNVQRLSLELGGNAPFIVFEDADLEQAAKDAVASSYRNAGQTCTCVNRVLVQASVHDAFVSALLAEVHKLRLGEGLDPATTQGPLISSAAVERVDGLMRDAVEQGATVAAGGVPTCEARLQGGHFYQPTVLTGVTPAMRVFNEEIFGPVTPLTAFDTEDEAIALANCTPFGLAAYLYTKDLGRMWRLPGLLEFGIVGVNEVAVTSEVAPFGGMKHSGMGIESSSHGLAEYQQLKTVCMRC